MYKFQCDAILFDLDGVLVDSTQVIERQWRLWAAHHQLDLRAITAIWHGRRAFEIIQTVAPHLNPFEETLQLAAAEAADTLGLQVYPGAYELLSRLPIERWAVATSGTRAVATARLAHAALPFPTTFVTADDVQRGKPNPDPYLLAASRLGFAAHRCIVIEDAPAGIDAALAAGAQVIAVASTHPKDQLTGATAIVNQLTDIQVISNGAGTNQLTIQVP